MSDVLFMAIAHATSMGAKLINYFYDRQKYDRAEYARVIQKCMHVVAFIYLLHKYFLKGYEKIDANMIFHRLEAFRFYEIIVLVSQLISLMVYIIICKLFLACKVDYTKTFDIKDPFQFKLRYAH